MLDRELLDFFALEMGELGAECLGALVAVEVQRPVFARIKGFDFEFATLVFEGPTLEVKDRRRDRGEARIVAVGIAQDIALTVVYTDRQDASTDVVRRIIAARRSNRREREAYQAAIRDPA